LEEVIAMIDCHVHLERGPYTYEWLNEFIKTAVNRGIDQVLIKKMPFTAKECLKHYLAIGYNDSNLYAGIATFNVCTTSFYNWYI
jgi:hypothetical protein